MATQVLSHLSKSSTIGQIVSSLLFHRQSYPTTMARYYPALIKIMMLPKSYFQSRLLLYMTKYTLALWITINVELFKNFSIQDQLFILISFKLKMYKFPQLMPIIYLLQLLVQKRKASENYYLIFMDATACLRKLIMITYRLQHLKKDGRYAMPMSEEVIKKVINGIVSLRDLTE